MHKNLENDLFAMFQSIDMAKLTDINIDFRVMFLCIYKLSNQFN